MTEFDGPPTAHVVRYGRWRWRPEVRHGAFVHRWEPVMGRRRAEAMARWMLRRYLAAQRREEREVAP